MSTSRLFPTHVIFMDFVEQWHNSIVFCLLFQISIMYFP